jgi:signal transduction histidine kinase
LRLSKIELEKTIKKLEDKNVELEKFAYTAAHDLKSPLGNIFGLTEIFVQNHSDSSDIEGQEILNLIKSSSGKLGEMIDGLLQYSKSDKNLEKDKIELNLEVLIKDLTDLFVFQNNSEITLKSNLTSINVNKTAVEQILINLVANAIKYNDKEITKIRIKVTEKEAFYKISVKDNGPGILPENHERIFQLFEVLSAEDRFGKNGNGIGLATVKKTVESLGGTITIDSKIEKGSKFTFTLSKF